MPEREIFEYLTTVQRMYVEGESREMVFNYFLQKLLKLTNSSLGFIAELLNDTNGKPYFHTLAETKMQHMDKTYIRTTDYHYLLKHEQGYCLAATDSNMFGELIKSKTPLIASSDRFAKVKYPNGHTPIESFLGIPFFYEDTMVGAIVLCNTLDSQYTTDQIQDLIPITYICSILLNGFNNRSLKEIYSKFVDKLHVPIAIFQTQTSCILDDRINLSGFYCISTNQAFQDSLQKNSGFSTHKLHGEPFYECFSNMIDNANIHDKIQEMFLTKTSQSLDILDYYDHNIPEDTYTFKFIYIDKQTFALWVEPISEQLKAQKVVDDLAKTNEEFFAKIVHEFRNPLNAIINVIALMNESPIVRQNNSSAIDLREKLQILGTSCVTLATLSQDITDYGQLKSKRLKLSYQPFDLSQVIDCTIGMINYDAHAKGININKKVDNNVPLCLISDPKRLRQVLINLCSNAVKFTERGHIGIYCRLKSYNPENEVYDILFEIQDTGRGIGPDEMDKLFKPFTQLRPKMDEFQGTGLGLVISKYLTQLLGGEIWVESELGRGTQFFFTIKAKRCSNEVIEEKYLPIIKHKRCLLADPFKTSRLLILKHLLKWDVKVTTCESLDEALLYMDTREFDVVIVDRRWDDTFKKYPNTIFISSKNEDVHDLQRPITSEDLLKHIVKFIDKSTYSSSSSPSQGNSPAAVNKRKASKRPLTILLAEDNYINRQVELESLKLIGFEKVDVAEDGKQAIELMKEFKYDVLLLDLKMPVMDGYQAFAYLTQHPDMKPYTIALTGNAMAKDRERCLNMGMDQYITKPIDMNLLKNVLLERQRFVNNRL